MGRGGQLGRWKWRDKSRTDDTKTRSHLARSRTPAWSATIFRPGNRQEAFVAEPVALSLQLLAEWREEGAGYTVFTDSQTAM